MAAQQGHWKCMELLLENGADVNAKDTKGKTPMSCAIGKPECVDVIERYNGKTNMLIK